MSARFYRFLPMTFPATGQLLVCVITIYTATTSLTKEWIHHACAEKDFLIRDVFTYAPPKNDIWACLRTTCILHLCHHCFFRKFPFSQCSSNLPLLFTMPNLPFSKMKLVIS